MISSAMADPQPPTSHPHLIRQHLPYVTRTREIRFALGERTRLGVCQVRGLRKNQELVEGIYTKAGDQFQPHGQTHATEVTHRLVEREATGVTQGPVRAPEFVFNNVSGVAKQYPSRLLLVLDHLLHDMIEMIEQVSLRPTQRRLIRDLKEVTHHLT